MHACHCHCHCCRRWSTADQDLHTRCERSLRLACDALPECKGFTSNGVLVSSAKSAVQRAAPDQQTHLFAKVAASTGPGNVWPAPQSWSAGSASVAVAYPFTFRAVSPSTDLIAALVRFDALTFSQRALKPAQAPAALLSELLVTVADQSVPLQLGVDESYDLTIPADGSQATLNANTYYGALRGLETFSQLVNFNYSGHAYVIGNAPWSISDAPRFAHRGVMIDTARHFEPVTTIKTVIDSLTYAKFNTLHWHVVDSQVRGKGARGTATHDPSFVLFLVFVFVPASFSLLSSIDSHCIVCYCYSCSVCRCGAGVPV